MKSVPQKTKDYLNCMLQIPPLSDDDLRTALLARMSGDEWARRLLEERFLPKVIAWVLPYRNPGFELMDLIEIGNRALLRGLRQLKPGLAVDATDYLENCVVAGVEEAVLLRQE
jgi:hypothetical protein